MHAVRPPEYFPGPAFWALMVRCDRFVLADTFQYSRQSFQNRAKLRNPNGWQWITVPLTRGQHTRPIRDVEIDNTVPWRGKHLRALSYNYRSTPYFEYYEDSITDFFESEWTHLGQLTVASIELVAEMLHFPAPETLSRTPENALEMTGPELLLETDPDQLDGVRLSFAEPTYQQNFDGFEPGMSILDMMFNCGPETESLLRGGSVDQRDARNNGHAS